MAGSQEEEESKNEEEDGYDAVGEE